MRAVGYIRVSKVGARGGDYFLVAHSGQVAFEAVGAEECAEAHARQVGQDEAVKVRRRSQER